MKKKLIFAMSTAILAAGLSFGVSYEANATKETCRGRTVFGDGNYANPQCKRIGNTCNRPCGFLEIN